jgi:uncharacterized protein DUF1116
MTAATSRSAVSDGKLHPADELALQRMLAAEPVWVDLVPARDSIALPDKTILHAGPPLGESICRPILNSVVMAVLFEGWADSEAAARRLIEQRAVHLLPAQDFNAVVPLAAVLTQSMLTHVIADRSNAGNRCVSTINGGNGPALRLGKAAPDVVQHLRWLNGEFGELLKRALVHELPLLPIARAALAQGDDLHGRTPAATALLCRALFGEVELIAFLQHSPGFFLNIWMAACKSMAMAASAIVGSSAVVAFGGNGESFGLKVSGLPDRWFTAPAQPPNGMLENGFTAEDRLGAIGDSAIVDAAGFGAMAMHGAPLQQQALQAFMPAPSRELGRKVLAASDPRFPGAEIRSGLVARHIAAIDATPAISLGVLDRSGRAGRIGGGIYLAPHDPFVAACDVLRDRQ